MPLHTLLSCMRQMEGTCEVRLFVSSGEWKRQCPQERGGHGEVLCLVNPELSVFPRGPLRRAGQAHGLHPGNGSLLWGDLSNIIEKPVKAQHLR